MIGGDLVRLPVLWAAKPAGALAVQRGSVRVKVSEQAHLCAVVNYLVQDVLSTPGVHPQKRVGGPAGIGSVSGLTSGTRARTSS
jgi:hypothetical protein